MGNNGGRRPNSGRKSKAEEMGLASLLEKSFPPEARMAVFENLARIAQSNNEKAAISASSLLLAYAFGKPTEKHEHSGDADKPIILKVEYAE